LEECLGLHEGLLANAPATFDFILGASETLAIIKDARKIVEQLYQHSLKAGGLMLFTELALTEGPEGWMPPHPAMGDLLRPGLIPLASYNPGAGEVATVVQNWLEDLGATEKQQYKIKVIQGGYTEQGRFFLRNTLLFLQIAGPQFVTFGLITQQRFDELWRTIQREIAPQHVGFTHYVVTMARKPL
jgi:hypothetical protein